LRRTEQEFKEEVWSRSRQYRKEQAKRRKTMLSIGLCTCIFCITLTVFDPFGAKSEAPAADMMLMQESKMENAMAQHSTGGTDRNMTTNAAPAENAATSMDKEPAAVPEETPKNEIVMGAGMEGSLSRSYNVVAIEVKTYPEAEEHYRLFADIEKTVPVIVAIERFYSANTAEESERTDMVYEIVVTYKNRTESYSLVGNGLYSEAEGFIGTDTKAAAKLRAALAQTSDRVPDVSVSKFRASNSWPLHADDALTIQSYLETGEWIEGKARCATDYTLYVDGETYHYHSDCGTIQNGYGQLLTLSEAEKQIVNAILESYMD